MFTQRKMKEFLSRWKKVIWGVAIAGVGIGYLGLWLDIGLLLWTGLVLAIPLFIIVLPYCLFVLLALFTRPVWLPFYKHAIKRNGAPFHAGDWVRILHGQHQSQIVRVYEVWIDRDQVRVELGEKEKEDVRDVFSFLQVRRIERSEQMK